MERKVSEWLLHNVDYIKPKLIKETSSYTELYELREMIFYKLKMEILTELKGNTIDILAAFDDDRVINIIYTYYVTPLINERNVNETN